MAAIQSYPDELDYVNAQLHPMQRVGAFLDCFLNACLRADSDNYEVLRPVLKQLMEKYPASQERIEMERRDRGL